MNCKKLKDEVITKKWTILKCVNLPNLKLTSATLVLSHLKIEFDMMHNWVDHTSFALSVDTNTIGSWTLSLLNSLADFVLFKKWKWWIGYNSLKIHYKISNYGALILWYSGGSRGGRHRHVPPPRVEILSFWHTNFTKRSRLGSWHPPMRLAPPLREILDALLWYVVNYHRPAFKCEPDVGHIQIMAWVNGQYIELFLINYWLKMWKLNTNLPVCMYISNSLGSFISL